MIETATRNAPIKILDVQVHNVDFEQTMQHIDRWIQERRSRPLSSQPHRCRQICTVNPEFVMQAHRQAQVAEMLNQADLCVPDGIGILWAARILGTRLQERVTGSDGIYLLSERASQKGWRVFLLGAAPGVADRAAQRLQERYPQLCIVGAESGSPQDADWHAIRHRLAQAQPDLLFVAFGHPQQDLWIRQHRNELPATVAIGVGGAFDFVAGVTRRAPRWMQQLGVEWLHRLIQQPWRWRRMLALPMFVWLVLNQKLRAQ